MAKSLAPVVSNQPAPAPAPVQKKRGRPRKPDAMVPMSIHVSRERREWLKGTNASKIVRDALDAFAPLQGGAKSAK